MVRGEVAVPARNRPREIDRSSPAWTITYADMATLLLTFFIFLFSASQVSEARFQAAIGSLRANLGTRPKYGSVVETRSPSEVTHREKLRELRQGAPGERTQVLAASQGARIVVGGRIPFERNQAELGEAAKVALRRIADELRGLPNLVEVRGHCERGEGVASGRADDLALSLERAANALRFMVDECYIPARQLRAVGVGSEEPADAGLHADDPARDRRVEVVVVRELAPQGR